MSTDTRSTSLLTFGMGTDIFAIPLTRVREIVGCPRVARVPRASESVRGVMNLRGNVVPVIDLARHFGIGDTTFSDTTCAVLIDSPFDGESSPLAGLVQEIHGVIDSGELRPTPEFGIPVTTRLLRGITPQGDGFAYVIDIDALLESLS